MIVDFPELASKSWHFLSEKEADFIVARIEHDRHDIKLEPFSLGAYLRNSLDSKVWAFSALYMFTTTNSYAVCILCVAQFSTATNFIDCLLPSNHPQRWHGIR